MLVRRKLMPAAALALAIGASAAGAATAAATTTSGTTATTTGSTAGGADKAAKPVCKIVLKDGMDRTDKQGAGDKAGADTAIGTAIREGLKSLHLAAGADAAKAAGPAAAAAAAAGKGPIEVLGGQAGDCPKQVKVLGLDAIAAKLGVTKAALAQALVDTGKWAAASPTKPTVAQFDQHLADLLHVPEVKITSLFGTGRHFIMKSGK